MKVMADCSIELNYCIILSYMHDGPLLFFQQDKYQGLLKRVQIYIQ